jgi:hypothetical protein
MDVTDSWGVEERLWRGCEEYKRPVKEMFMAEERRLHPNQPSAMDRDRNRGDDRHSDGGDISPDQRTRCEKFVKVQIRRKGDGCLGRRPASKRKECFDCIGKMLQTRKYKGKVIGDLCGPVFEPIKDEYRNREMEKWPNEPSSFD